MAVVLVRVAGHGGVVGLDVELDVLVEPVRLEEGDDGLRVVVVLVLGGLLGLGFDEELEGGSDVALVLDGHVEEGGQVVQLSLHVGVEVRDEALAAAPEHVVHPTQLVRHLHGLLYLRSSVRKHVRVGVGGRAVHVAGVGEEVGGAPQQLHSTRLLQLLRQVRQLVEDGVGLCHILALRCDVSVVEGVEAHAQLGEELEGGAQAALGVVDALTAVVPVALGWSLPRRCPAPPP